MGIDAEVWIWGVALGVFHLAIVLVLAALVVLVRSALRRIRRATG